jgi:hypothetical protein
MREATGRRLRRAVNRRAAAFILDTDSGVQVGVGVGECWGGRGGLEAEERVETGVVVVGLSCRLSSV